MKINSSTFSFDRISEEYQAIEQIIKKIATDNNVTDIESVHATINAEDGVIVFKEASIEEESTK